jgi:hypothetical protein
MIAFPSAKNWEILTDGTERGGSSKAEIIDTSTGLEFSGSVGSIAGRTGPVGFAIARFPFRTDPKSEFAELQIESDKDIVLSLVASIPQTASEKAILTYQSQVVLKRGLNILRVPWTSFEPVYRGERVLVAPPFDKGIMNAFALQIRRGAQEESLRWQPSDIFFQLKIRTGTQ